MAEPAPRYEVHEHKASDGYRWRYRSYAPSGEARARVVCLHGIQSHGGWYDHSCTRLSDAGFAVDFLDRRGSGVNKQGRGDTPSFRRLLDDLAEYLESLRADKKVPIFLVAISWGGKLAIALERYRTGLIDGMALLCPGVFPVVKPPFLQRFRILFCRLIRPRSRFPIPLDRPDLFTGTAHWQRFIENDPLSLRRLTARMLVESVRLDYYLRAAPPRVQAPVLLLLAERDRIIDNARTREFVERFAARDTQVIEYPGAHHTLEFEPDPDLFIEDLRRWLERMAATRRL